MKPSRAISIRQPYAEQILRGTKRLEFRSRSTTIRERVWIYAANRPAADVSAWRAAKAEPGSLPTGRIIGSVEIVGVLRRGRSDFAYQLARPKRLARARDPTNQPQPVFWRPKF